MNFIDYWNKGNFEAKRVLTTLLLIVLVYLVSSSFLFLDLYLNFPNSDLVDQSSIKDLSLLMGKNRLFLWMKKITFNFLTIVKKYSPLWFRNFGEMIYIRRKNICGFYSGPQ